MVTGIAVRYGDEARIYGFRERIAKGALNRLPTQGGEPHACSTIALCRSACWSGRTTTTRCGSERSYRGWSRRRPGAHGRAEPGCCAERRWSSCRRRKNFLETDTEKGPLYEIVKAKVVRLSLVDDGAYPQSSINLRLEQPSADAALRLAIEEGNPRKRDHRRLMAV